MADTTGTTADGARRAERLELRVPTSPTQLPAVRAMAGDLAMRMDFDLDAVEDLRLAVDEACATLAGIAADDQPLTVVFEASRSGLHIDAWVPTDGRVEVPRDGFGWAVLATLVDTVDAGTSTQAKVPAGDGSDGPVSIISVEKLLAGGPLGGLTGAGHDLSVAQ